MTLCADNHDEVCYNGRNCPVCDKMKEISDLEDMVAELKQEIENHE